MININLLPEKNKKSLKLEKKMRWLILLSMILVTSLILASAGLYVWQSFNYYFSNDGVLLRKQINLLEEKISVLKNEQSFIAQLPKANSFNYLSQLQAIKPAGIKFSSIELNQKELKIKGEAPTRASFLKLESQLKNLYKKVTSPLSNLLGANFVFTIDIASAKKASSFSQGIIILENPAKAFKLIPSRFQSPEGLIFWSQETIDIIPGINEIPVIAEQAGSKYNISPSQFTMPAFLEQNNNKYYSLKVYSQEPMKGGKDNE